MQKKDLDRLSKAFAEKAAKKYNRTRRKEFFADADVDYINSGNEKFNAKVIRFFLLVCWKASASEIAVAMILWSTYYPVVHTLVTRQSDWLQRARRETPMGLGLINFVLIY